MSFKKIWTNQEINLLKQLFNKYGQKKWKIISKQLKKKGFKRSQLEIRSKWINNINPSLSHDDWNPQQLQQIYNLYNKIGPRWALINSKIHGRTQNKIKNKFYGNLRIYVRFVYFYFEKNINRNQISINKIPPSILNCIFQGIQDFIFMNNEVSQALKMMNYIIDKKLLKYRIQNNIQIYQLFHQKMNQIFIEMKQNQQIKQMIQQSQVSSFDKKDEEFIFKQKRLRDDSGNDYQTLIINKNPNTTQLTEKIKKPNNQIVIIPMDWPSTQNSYYSQQYYQNCQVNQLYYITPWFLPIYSSQTSSNYSQYYPTN